MTTVNYALVKLAVRRALGSSPFVATTMSKSQNIIIEKGQFSRFGHMFSFLTDRNSFNVKSSVFSDFSGGIARIESSSSCTLTSHRINTPGDYTFDNCAFSSFTLAEDVILCDNLDATLSILRCAFTDINILNGDCAIYVFRALNATVVATCFTKITSKGHAAISAESHKEENVKYATLNYSTESFCGNNVAGYGSLWGGLYGCHMYYNNCTAAHVTVYTAGLRFCYVPQDTEFTAYCTISDCDGRSMIGCYLKQGRYIQSRMIVTNNTVKSGDPVYQASGAGNIVLDSCIFSLDSPIPWVKSTAVELYVTNCVFLRSVPTSALNVHISDPAYELGNTALISTQRNDLCWDFVTYAFSENRALSIHTFLAVVHHVLVDF